MSVMVYQTAQYLWTTVNSFQMNTSSYQCRETDHLNFYMSMSFFCWAIKTLRWGMRCISIVKIQKKTTSYI